VDTALVTGYQQPAPLGCTLIRLDMLDGAICLTDGGFAWFDAGEGAGVEIYYGRHPVYGALGALPTIKDGAESQTTRVTIPLLPPSDEAAALLGQPSVQGVRVQWWEGVIDPDTAAFIGAPLLKFDGEIDRPRLTVGDSRSIILDCGTQAERQLEPNTDWRLNDAFHQRIWPGELGLIHMTNVLKKSEWRERPPNPGLFKRFLQSLVPLRK